MHFDSASSQSSVATVELFGAAAKQRLEQFGYSIRLALRSFRWPKLPSEIDLKDLGYPPI
jgi:hypothetical protein